MKRASSRILHETSVVLFLQRLLVLHSPLTHFFPLFPFRPLQYFPFHRNKNARAPCKTALPTLYFNHTHTHIHTRPLVNMASHVEGRLLRRSVPYVENWIAELAPKVPPAAPAGAGAAAAGSPKGKEKTAKGKNGGGAPTGADNATAMSRCCFAVGKVVEVSRHPESAKLYIEKIDLGAELNAFSNNEPRTILSGLQEFVKEEDFLNRLVLVIANLEPRKIGGIPSAGMVICASTGEDPHDPASAGQGERKVVLLDIPEGTAVGERVVFEGHDMPYEPVLKKKLAKNFEEVMQDVCSNAEGVVCWQGKPFKTSKGVIKASLCNARIS